MSTKQQDSLSRAESRLIEATKSVEAFGVNQNRSTASLIPGRAVQFDEDETCESHVAIPGSQEMWAKSCINAIRQGTGRASIPKRGADLALIILISGKGAAFPSVGIRFTLSMPCALEITRMLNPSQYPV